MTWILTAGIACVFLAAAAIFLGLLIAPTREQRESEDEEFLEYLKNREKKPGETGRLSEGIEKGHCQ